ncbi:MAG: methyltransferase [Planctomycetota bacterium]
MANFRYLKQFDDPENVWVVDTRRRLQPKDESAFPGDGAIDRFARVLCKHRATCFRELVEALEFFALARKHARARVVADLCGGHGLVAVLFAVFEPSVERVIVLDRSRPASFDRIVQAAEEAAPWIAGRVEYLEAKLKTAPKSIPRDAGLVAVHACGVKTDRVLELAIANQMPVAVMPCCHPVSASKAPPALKKALAHMAVDVDRTYQLEAAGFHVRWTSVSDKITRMNRVILARPRSRAATQATATQA